MTETADVVIIGSGIVGSSVAYHLAARGYVVLSDVTKEEAPAAEAAPVIAPPTGIPAEMTEDEEVVSLLTRAQQALKARDFEKAQRMLDWRPSYDLDAALLETIEWYRDYFAMNTGVPVKRVA